MSLDNSKHTVGSMRFTADIRQIAALLTISGLCAIVQPLASIASLISPDGGTVTEGIPFASLWGGLCLVAIGIVTVFIGYNQLVHDWKNQYLTMASIVLTQTAFIPYITGMTAVGRTAASGVGFFAPTYPDPDESHVKFVGAMIILGILSYGFAFVGSISFMQFSLLAYQNGKPQDRSASYYSGRMGFYTLMLLIAGLSQTMLGGLLSANYPVDDNGSLSLGRVGGNMYVVYFPWMAMTVGAVQVLNAVWGMLRSRGMLQFGGNDFSYQISIYAGWLLQLVLQIMVQYSYAPKGELAGAVPSVMAMSVGLNMMPAFLDYKMRSTPEQITPEYYGLTSDDELASTVEDGKASAVAVEQSLP